MAEGFINKIQPREAGEKVVYEDGTVEVNGNHREKQEEEG